MRFGNEKRPARSLGGQPVRVGARTSCNDLLGRTARALRTQRDLGRKSVEGRSGASHDGGSARRDRMAHDRDERQPKADQKAQVTRSQTQTSFPASVASAACRTPLQDRLIHSLYGASLEHRLPSLIEQILLASQASDAAEAPKPERRHSLGDAAEPIQQLPRPMSRNSRRRCGFRSRRSAARSTACLSKRRKRVRGAPRGATRAPGAAANDGNRPFAASANALREASPVRVGAGAEPRQPGALSTPAGREAASSEGPPA